MKRFTAVFFAVLLTLLCGCERIDDGSSMSASSDESLEGIVPIDGTEPATAYTEYVATSPKIEKKDTNIKIEAEDYNLTGSLYTSDVRGGYSGDGYVTGFFGGSGDCINMTVRLEASQHYDISLCAAADASATSSIVVNGDKLQDFTIKGDGIFTKITLYGIYMNKGDNDIVIKSGSSDFDLDYIEITNNDSVYESKFELDNSASNKNVDSETDILLKALKLNFGRKIITGQYVSSPENRELELIYELTGKYPAIRFSDIGGYAADGMMYFDDEIAAAKEWYKKGGITGFMWYWTSPGSGAPTVYSKETTFSLGAAMTKKDIADMPVSEIEDLYKKGFITMECLEIIKDIDAVSNALLSLADDNIPVLWRPLHEAGGGWYWWGSDGAEPYKWLYTLMYRRMTDYHKLNNLIWIWNGQSADYLIDSEYYDIAAADIYLPPESDFGSRLEQYQWLRSVTGGEKILAISESSSVPDPDGMLRDNSLWSFFGLWYGEYLTDIEGNFSELYTRRESLIKLYNAQNTITLGDF